MQQNKKFFKFSTLAIFAASVFAAGNASAKQESMDFTATISTNEISIAAPLCASQQGGIGSGAGSTNLFPNPVAGTPNAVLASSDCVTPVPGAVPPVTDFGPGILTISGAGGDSIFAKYSGRLVFAGANSQTSFTFAFESSTLQVIGGTGRYEKAKGTATITGTEVIDFLTKTSKGNLVATGRIVY